MKDHNAGLQETEWTRGSFVALIVSILLLLTVLALNAYRYTLPTEGWAYQGDDFSNGTAQNVLGLLSNLEVGDIPVTVGNLSMEEVSNLPLGQAANLPAEWHAGGTVPFTVKRGEQTLTVPVPIGNWNLYGIWNSFSSNWLTYFIGLLYLLIGVLVFVLRPGNPAAQVLLFLGSVRVAMDFVVLIPFAIGDTGNIISFTGAALLGFYIWGIFLFPTFFLLSLVFPNPKRPFRTHPVLTVAFLYLLEPLLLLAFGSQSAETGPSIGFGLVAIFGFLTVISLIHTIITARGNAVTRAQILWVTLGVALVAGFQFLENAFGFVVSSKSPRPPEIAFWLDLVNGIIYLGLPVAVAIAILRYRLFDIDIIIRRTLTYTVLVICLLLVYFGSVVVLQQAFVLVSGQNSEIITVLSTLAIAALFVPLRSRIQQLIDHRFYRKKYDAQQVLNDFANTVRDETDLDRLAGQLMQVMDETMQPTSVSVWLNKPEPGVKS